jgi:cold shock protein
MMSGYVRHWIADRGFGFIHNDDTAGDIFVHISVVERSGYCALTPGQRIKFEVGTNPRNGKSCAVNLELIEPLISPPLAPEAGDKEQHLAHMEFGRTEFMRR